VDDVVVRVKRGFEWSASRRDSGLGQALGPVGKVGGSPSERNSTRAVMSGMDDGGNARDHGEATYETKEEMAKESGRLGTLRRWRRGTRAVAQKNMACNKVGPSDRYLVGKNQC